MTEMKYILLMILSLIILFPSTTLAEETVEEKAKTSPTKKAVKSA